MKNPLWENCWPKTVALDGALAGGYSLGQSCPRKTDGQTDAFVLLHDVDIINLLSAPFKSSWALYLVGSTEK